MIHPESLDGKTVFVGVVEGCNISSFGSTESEAFSQTAEALFLYLDVEIDLRLAGMMTSPDRVYKKASSTPVTQYTINIDDQVYA